MLTSLIVRIIGFCIGHAWTIVVVGLLAAGGSVYYAASHFRLNSDINAVLPNDLGWRQRELAFETAFRRFELIEIVVSAPTPELTGAATAEIAEALAREKDEFDDVSSLGGSPFFARHGLLFLTKDALERNLGGLVQGEPLIRDLATDRSLRGLVAGLEDALLGVQNGRLKLDDLAAPLDAAAATVEQVLAGEPASFSWRALSQGKPAAPGDLRGFIEVRPKLDFRALEPGLEASEAIRRVAAAIAPKYQATVRLTGPVAMSDEQFGTIKENALRNALITLGIVAVILWLALRSGRLIAAVTVNLVVGLALTAALGLLMVGAFNLISVYFAVLFVGIGLDFGIQYSVRYRSERHDSGALRPAILQAGFHVGAPLTLAAFATAAGFLSFLPTDYRGVSELGLIAGCGMLIAFATSITLLPALISVMNPPGEPEPLGYSALAPVDNFMMRHRIAIIAGTAIVVFGGLPLLYWLSFDFNPIDLQNPDAEATATYLELSRDPSTDANAIQVLAPCSTRPKRSRRGWPNSRWFRMPRRSTGSFPSSRTKSCRSSAPRRPSSPGLSTRRTPSRRLPTPRMSMRSTRARTACGRPPTTRKVRARSPPGGSRRRFPRSPRRARPGARPPRRASSGRSASISRPCRPPCRPSRSPGRRCRPNSCATG